MCVILYNVIVTHLETSDAANHGFVVRWSIVHNICYTYDTTRFETVRNNSSEITNKDISHDNTVLFARMFLFWKRLTATYLVYFTLDELFCHMCRVDRQSDVSPSPSCLRMSSGFPSPCTISVHHPPNDFVAFPSVVVLLAGSRLLCSGEPLVPSVWRVTTTWSCSCLLSTLLVACLLAA